MEGDQPEDDVLDYRYSLANERTFLAWIRTALALDASGLAVRQLVPPLRIPYARDVLATLLVVLGTVVAVASLRRWRSYEQHMRAGRPLPAAKLPTVMALGVGLISLIAIVLLVANLTA